MISKTESYRLNMLRNAQENYEREKQAELEANEKKLEAREVISRCSLPLPSEDACPSCWCRHGAHHSLRPVPEGTRRRDVFRCLTCGYEHLVDQ